VVEKDGFYLIRLRSQQSSDDSRIIPNHENLKINCSDLQY
jgi:hypothetical protein